MGQAIKGYHIETTGSDYILSQNRKISVFVDHKTYILKDSSELVEGDRILVERKPIKKSLEDILPILKNDLFYKHALEHTHTKNTNGQNVSNLRVKLLEGLILNGYLPNTEETRAKILMEKEFSEQELEQVISNISGAIELSDTNGVRKKRIKEWLNGKTLQYNLKGIENESELLTALSILHPDFENLRDKEDSNSWRYNVRFLRAVHSSVEKYLQRDLSEIAQNGVSVNKSKKSSKNATNSSSDIKIDVLADKIRQSFMTDFDENYSIATITKATAIRANTEQYKKTKGLEGKLGEYEIETDLSNLQELSMEEIITQKYAIKQIMYQLIYAKINNLNDIFDMSEWKTKYTKSQLVEVFLKGIIITNDNSLENFVYSKILPKDIFKNLYTLEEVCEKTNLSKDIFMELLNVYNTFNNINPFNSIVNLTENNVFKECGLDLDLEKLKKIIGSKLVEKELELLYSIKPIFLENKHSYLFEKYKGKDLSKYFLSYDETAKILQRNNLPLEILDQLADSFKYDSKYQARIKQEENQKRGEEVLNKARSGIGYIPNLSKAGKKHDQLVDLLAKEPEFIEEGLELLDIEYQIDDGWARTDIRYKDSKGQYLVVEVKQEAENNQSNFDNAKKAVTQTAGYQRAVEAQLIYDGIQNPQVRGMLVAYTISDNAKSALERLGLEYRELLPELREMKKEIREVGLEAILV